MKQFIDIVTSPNEVEQTLILADEILNQCGFTPHILTGVTLKEIAQQELITPKLQFIVSKKSISPYPDSEFCHNLKQMEIVDTGVHTKIDNLKFLKDKITFEINNVPVVVQLLDKLPPEYVDPDTFRYGGDVYFVPNSKSLNKTYQYL